MTEKKKKERAKAAVAALKELYPDATCALEYGGDPWRLLVMGRLSAQCTDARVNVVCRELFAHYPDAYAMAAAEYESVEKLVFSCGVYKVKAANIVDFSKMIIENFGGNVPDNMDDLLTLPGVGRKIANLILGDIYHKPAIVADTHCIRISNRWELCDSRDPKKVELALAKLVPGEEQSDFCHRIVLFGRDICPARSPKCGQCPFKDFGCKLK
ncbi:MAG: endonuclease III [Clostridia bacterium]|nr:endonuclease III [Clostridia bacterium]